MSQTNFACRKSSTAACNRSFCGKTCDLPVSLGLYLRPALQDTICKHLRCDEKLAKYRSSIFRRCSSSSSLSSPSSVKTVITLLLFHFRAFDLNAMQEYIIVVPIPTVLPRSLFPSHSITVDFVPIPAVLPWLPRFYRCPHPHAAFYFRL